MKVNLFLVLLKIVVSCYKLVLMKQTVWSLNFNSPLDSNKSLPDYGLELTLNGHSDF